MKLALVAVMAALIVGAVATVAARAQTTVKLEGTWTAGSGHVLLVFRRTASGQ